MVEVSGGEWRGKTGDAWAQEWRRTDRSFSMLTDRLLQRSREISFADVLDIGCGAGELSLAIAREHPGVTVTGLDISAALVATARERAENLGNASFLLADAAIWRPQGNRPDLLVSRHGVMFFADPAAAFTNLAHGAVAGAGLLFSCFRSPQSNPFMTEVARLLPPPVTAPDPHAPGPFAFADAARVEQILQSAGWLDVDFEEFDFGMIAGAGENPVEEAMAYFTSIGPGARAAAELSAEDYQAFLPRLRELVEAHEQDGIVALRAAAWIVTAHRA